MSRTFFEIIISYHADFLFKCCMFISRVLHENKDDFTHQVFAKKFKFSVLPHIKLKTEEEEQKCNFLTS